MRARLESRGEANKMNIHSKSLKKAITKTQSVSPQNLLRTIIHLDSDHDSDISPLSDEHRPPTHSSTVLARLFPELAPSLPLVSPISADQTMRPIETPFLLERELVERVQNLYQTSTADAQTSQQTIDPSSASNETFDDASSCYSSRSSITSIGAEWAGENNQYKSADTYSVYNPVSAGVFDDTASCPSRAPSAVSRLSHRQSKDASHSRHDSMEDLKNKPLPLEPVAEPSPLVIRRQLPRSERPSATSSSREVSTQQRGESRQPRRGYAEHLSRHQRWHGHPHGQRLRQVPSLSQAAKELEYALGDLAKDPNFEQRTLLVLDGPLQIRRHDGDLVATRPAPLPPTTKRLQSKEETKEVKPVKSKDEGKKDKVKIKSPFALFGRKPDDRRLSSLDPLETGTPSRAFSPPSPASDNLTPTSCKREDLLLQLPRLQTQDLEFNNFLDSFKIQRLSGSRSPTLLPARGDAQQTMSPERRLAPPTEEKILVVADKADKVRHAHAFVSTAQASSVHLPPEQVYELAATPPSPSTGLPRAAVENVIAANLRFPLMMPENAVVLIMESIGSLDDLFNYVLVNKRVYSIFKKRELPLIKSALYKMSPPAWELREMSPPWVSESQFWVDPDAQVPEYTATLYLDRYARDIYTLAQLKSMILVRCAPFLRRDTLRGLSGVDPVRAEEVDDAFWRIWTFCRIFGSGKGRENDMEGQMDWLKGGVRARSCDGAASTMTEPFGMNNVLFEPPEGFALGNRGGLSQRQMYDMTEIWTCLAVLLQGLHGKCEKARDVGIFDGMSLQPSETTREETALEEWTSYVLTLGLSAVLTLSSLCPAEATAETFEKAKQMGLTKWELTETETTRSSFLKEAISRVYEEQERVQSARSDSPTDLLSQEIAFDNAQAERAREERYRAFKRELRARRLHASSDRDLGTTFASERPMSEFSTIVRNLDGSIGLPTRTSTADVQPVPPVPALTFDRSSTSTVGTAPRTPNLTPSPSNHSVTSIPLSRSPPPPPPSTLAPPRLQPQVQDPVDRAIARMVKELGFDEDDVKWALKITDTGEGIDVLAAEHLLKQQKRKNQYNPFAPRGKNSLLHSVMKHQGSQDSGWRWA